MGMNRISVLGAGLLAVRLAAGGETDLPFRIDPDAVPRPNGTTVLLWRFEDGAAADSTIGRNNGHVTGGVRTEGRHGGAVRLAGGTSGAVLDSMAEAHAAGGTRDGVSLIVDFWCRAEAGPGLEACLLDLPAWGGVRLVLTPELALRLGREGGPALHVTPPLEPGVWTHVALVWTEFAQPNRVFDDARGIELLVNGASAGVLWDGDSPEGREPPHTGLRLGNDASGAAGFVGSVDEFRVSKGAAGVYPLVRPGPPSKAGSGPLERDSRYFRDPAARVLFEGFEDESVLRRVTPPDQPEFLTAEPPVITASGVGDGGPQTSLVAPGTAALLEEMEVQISRERAGAAVAVGLAPGSRGRGLVVRGGPVRLEVPATESGTLEFSFAPVNWDNLSAPAEGVAYAHRSVNLVTLWGLPRTGQGKAEPLASLSVNRAAGALPVRPEYRRWFARPVAEIRPHLWRHAVITWSDRFPHARACSIDGRPFAARFAEDPVWRSHRPAYVALGDGFETVFDDLQLLAYPLEGVELDNARAELTGEAMQPIAEAERGETIASLGEFPVETGMSQLPRISGGWLTGWVTGLRDRGAARTFFGFRPETGEMIVAVAPLDPAGVQRAEVSLQIDEGRSAGAAIPVFKDGMGGVVVAVGDLPEGTYRLTGTLYGDGESSRGQFESAFRRERFPDVENGARGLSGVPPAPFTPVEVNGNNVGAVGRVYAVGPDGNFESIEVTGEPILAAPIRFLGGAGGRAAELVGRGVEMGERTAGHCGWSAAAEGAGISIRSAVRFEFDGLARYQIEVRPVGAEAVVDRLSLLVPLRAAQAQFFHVLGPNTGLRNPYVAGALKPGEGRVWDSRTDFTARQLGRWPCQMWLGGPVRGLVWYADNDQGWASADDQPPVTVERAGEVVTLGLHIIARPVVLKAPLRLSYTLLATPPKPLPEDYRLWNRGHLETAGKAGGRLTSCDSFAPWVVPCRAETFAYWPPGDDWSLVRAATERQRRGDGGKYPPGQALMMYHDKNKTPLHPDMLAYYGWSWGLCRYPPARINHMIASMDRMIGAGYDGVYIDDVFPFGDWNLSPLGTSYLAEKGDGTIEKRCGSAAGEYREYMKRLYGLFAAHGKRPLITTHMTSTLGWPYHAFATVAFDHEHAERFKDPGSTFMDAWPLDYLMTLDIPERSGLVTVPMLKGKYLEGRSVLQAWAAERSFQAVWMLFDLNMPLDGTVMEPYYGRDVAVHPFWRNAHLLAVVPTVEGPVQERDLPPPTWWKSEHVRQGIGAQPLRATLYKRDRRCLLIVANFLRRAVGATVTLNLEALGVPEAARDRLTVADVDRDRPPAGVDLGRLHLADGPARGAGPPEIGASLTARAAGAEEADGEGLEALLQGVGASGDPFHAIESRSGVVRMNVGPQNFRALEVRW